MAITLTADEESMLESDVPAMRKSMELLVRLGDIYGATEFVEIGSAQASGISYKSIGDPGVEFLEGFAEEGATVQVQTFANPAGMDIERYEEMGVSEEFARQQRRIVAALRTMGVTVSFTCTPYLAGNLPGPNEHIAWAESSAVSFANSVIGARTNREGGPSALAAAITGRTPKHGLHLDENRVPTHLVDVEVDLETQADFATLGAWTGRIVEDGRPYFSGIDGATSDQLKSLGAAMAATGAVAMHFVGGVTTDENPPSDTDRLQYGTSEHETEYTELSSTKDTDLIVFGCPHSSVEEIRTVADRLEGETLDRDLWVCTSRSVKSQADRMGYTDTIEDAGGLVLSDTCNVVAPIEELGYESTATDSAKAASYLPGFGDQLVRFDDKQSLLDEAIER